MSVTPLNGQINDEKYNDIESDSDESIIEVPVPAKPKPPLINLDDSSEDSGDSEDIKCISIRPPVINKNCNTVHLENEIKNLKVMKCLVEELSSVLKLDERMHSAEIQKDK